MATVNCMLIPTAVKWQELSSGNKFRGVVISAAPEFEDAPVWESPVLRDTRLQAEADAAEAVVQLAAQARRQLRLL